MNDAGTLLRELRPDAPEGAPDLDVLERILLAGPEPELRRRPRVARPVAIGGAVCALAAAGVAMVAAAPSGGGGSPSVLAQAAAALDRPDKILHLKTVEHLYGTDVRTQESWQTTGGRRLRTVSGDGFELAMDEDARTLQTYDPRSNAILDHTDPGYFAGGTAGPGLQDSNAAVALFGDLGALLKRAADGDDPGRVRLLDDTEVRGVAVHHIQLRLTTRTSDRRGAPAETVRQLRDVYLARDSNLPVQVVDEPVGPADNPTLGRSVTDVVSAEQLPLNADTSPLLALAEHPGATRSDEGPFR